MSQTIDRIKNKLIEIISSRHRLAQVMRFEEYAKSFHPDDYHLIEKDRQTIVLNSQFYGEPTVMSQNSKLPDAYWMKLRHGQIIGGSDVVISSDGIMLYDLLASADEYGANVTDGGLFLLFGKPHTLGKRYIYRFSRKNKGYFDKGIDLSANMSGNYFHFMFQIASKMLYIENSDIEKSVPLLMDERVLEVPQMKEVICLLNENDRVIIPLKTNVKYEVGELFCFSNPHVVIPNSKSKFQTEKHINAFAYDIKALDFIKERVLRHLDNTKSQQPYPKRIFLSRKNCSKRRINEDELLPVLEKYGFKPVFTGEMDVVSQAVMFHQAEHIIGPSGAAFTNLLFCSEGCKVLLLLSRHHNTTCYSSLGCPLGAQIMFLAGNTDYTGLHAPFFSIDPNTMKQYLESIYGN